jgi:DNA end-binding protein Ku
MATIWKGSLTFGLVNVPVQVVQAVRADHIAFRQLHAEDLSPIKYERVCAANGEPVAWSEIVKGYEYEKGKFIVMTDDDFKAAAVERSQTLEILDFVKGEEIDFRHFETPYYLVPAKGGEKAYALLREAMRQGGTVGVGKIILRQTQHLAAIRVVGDALALEIMRFAGELIDANEYSFPDAAAVRPQELQMASQLIDTLTESFDPSKYTDEYRANLMKIIRAKLKGKKVELAEPAPASEDAKVVDLMERLRASLEEGRSGRRARGGEGSAKPAARKRRAARKSA